MRWAIFAILVLGSCRDSVPPGWGQDAHTTVNRTRHGVRVSWPEAVDDGELWGYRVELDGQQVRRMTASIRHFSSPALEDGEAHRVTIFALDEARNESAPLIADVPAIARPGGQASTAEPEAGR